MSGSYRLSSQAEFDLAEIWIQLARHSPSAADRLVADLHATFRLLAYTPGIGQRRPHLGAAIRQFMCGQYCVYYQAEDYGVYIVRVIHGARDVQTLTP